ncbi:hypothetical protein AA11826_2081 [Komagataeibacter oboediens DSM 11826]|uniref:Alpha/beta hydrolase n=1 Tax=Komagataeibacter oboediens TaxID=65958 RepID=A0A318QFG3_9PROT|nr:hypothetical protein CFR80_16640 [Komagataeibacter oboediens]GBR40622.1 hypothetical protein AA11826_2081 [Komagataeibacter oboediens DSM 11826]
MAAIRKFPDLLPGFSWRDIEVNGVRIRTATGGNGPPLLMLHGHPQSKLPATDALLNTSGLVQL